MKAWREAIALALLLACPPALRGQKEYVEYETFRAWRSLVPEIADARVCSLTTAGHELWAQGQLRMPAERFLRGDLSGSGREDWAIDLATGDEPGRCRYLLITTRTDDAWRRLLLQEIVLEDELSGFTPVWSNETRAIGIDFGRRKRLTAPATITWENGRVVEAKSGYVIEKALVSQLIRWNPETGAYEYENRPVPEEWDTESLGVGANRREP